MFSEGTKGYEVTNQYLNSNWSCNYSQFCALLGKNVVMMHKTNDTVYKAEGLEAVARIYKEKLFDILLSVNVVFSNITDNGLTPSFICSVINQKKDEEGGTFFVEYVDHTVLTLAEEEGKLLIQRIDTQAQKTILDSESANALSEGLEEYKVASDYVNSNYFLNFSKFCALLSEDVVMVHRTNKKNYEEEGKKNVTQLYKEKLFDVTVYNDVLFSNFTANGLTPEINCSVVSEKKNEDGTTFRAVFVDHTVLTLGKEGDKLLIQRIDTTATKTILTQGK